MQNTRFNGLTLDEYGKSYVDSTKDYITIGEYGYYDVKLNGLQAKLANEYIKGGSDDESINTIKIDTRIEFRNSNSRADSPGVTIGQHVMNSKSSGFWWEPCNKSSM